MGDLDGDGVTELAVGSDEADTANSYSTGEIHVLFLNRDGTAHGTTKIASGTNGGPTLSDGDRFGRSIVSLGDLDGDGHTDLAVGAHRDDTGGVSSGAVYLLFLAADTTGPTGQWTAINDRNTPVDSVTVTFSEGVQNVSLDDFTLSDGTLTSPLNTLAGVTLVRNSSNSYTVAGLAAHTATGTPNTTYTLAVRATGDIRDSSGNVLMVTPVESWRMDTTGAAVAVNQATEQADPVELLPPPGEPPFINPNPPLHFTVVFNEPVTGFTADDVRINGASTPVGTLFTLVTEVSPMDGTTYDVMVFGYSVGPITATIPAGAANDLVGNPTLASASMDNTVTVLPTRQPTPSVPSRPRGLLARLQVVKRGTARVLFVVLSFADTGQEKARFRSPFQKPTYLGIAVSVRDTDGDGIPDTAVLTGRKGKKTLTRTFSG